MLSQIVHALLPQALAVIWPHAAVMRSASVARELLGDPHSLSERPFAAWLNYAIDEARRRVLAQGAPAAAARDPKLYECLALVDAIRAGRTRDRKLAMSMLAERLRS